MAEATRTAAGDRLTRKAGGKGLAQRENGGEPLRERSASPPVADRLARLARKGSGKWPSRRSMRRRFLRAVLELRWASVLQGPFQGKPRPSGRGFLSFCVQGGGRGAQGNLPLSSTPASTGPPKHRLPAFLFNIRRSLSGPIPSKKDDWSPVLGAIGGTA